MKKNHKIVFETILTVLPEQCSSCVCCDECDKYDSVLEGRSEDCRLKVFPDRKTARSILNRMLRKFCSERVNVGDYLDELGFKKGK